MAGAIIGGIIQGASAAAATGAAAKASRKQRQWQERMSNTAFQRSRADMLAAGINPLLLGTGAPSASTPSGSTAKVFAPDMAGGAASGAAASLSSAKRSTEKEIKELTRQKQFEANSAAERNYASTSLLDAQREEVLARTRGENFTNVGRSVEAGIYGSQYGKYIKGAQLISQPVSSAAQAAGAIGLRGIGKRLGGVRKSTIKKPRRTQRSRKTRTSDDKGNVTEDIFLKEW